MLYIGVDLGGTGIKAGLVDEQGKILSKVSCPTGVERGYEAVIRDMAALCVKAVEESGRSMDEVKAIGIGLPGIADPATKRVPFCTNLGWHDVPVEEEMHRYLDKPIYIDNDATVAGLAESVAGVSAGAKNSVFVTLGTGVGGGVIINGKVFSGTHGVASEIGHMIVVAGGLGSLTGSILGSAVITVLLEWLRAVEDPITLGGFAIPGIPGMRMVVFSLVLLCIILYRREGIMGMREITWDAIFDFFSRRKRA